MIRQEPFASTWLQREDRTPRLRLVANPQYWDKGRGPRLQEVVFRNDLSPGHALDLVCDAEGEVDLLTEVAPADAARVEASEHAKLVALDAVRVMAAVINRDADGLPLRHEQARLALVLAVGQAGIIRDAMFGRARPVGALTPPAAVTALHRTTPHPHDPVRAAELWREAGGTGCRPLRILALGRCGTAARRAAQDIRDALGIGAEVAECDAEEEIRVRRAVAEKTTRPEWDLLMLEHGAQAADRPPLELHRAFVGADGEFRAGPVVPEFEALYQRLVRDTSKLAQAEFSYRIDRYVRDEALVLPLCASHALYAVNEHVDFRPYRTTFELADTSVGEGHWSRR